MDPIVSMDLDVCTPSHPISTLLSPTGPKPGSKSKSKSKAKPKKGKSNKSKFDSPHSPPRKRFDDTDPAVYVTVTAWKRMTKEQQQAARAKRREMGIPIRCEPSISPTLSNNNPPSLQLPSFDRARQAGSEGTTMDLCGVSTAPHSVNDAMILDQ